MKLLSIIIPAYNEERFIKKVIDSVIEVNIDSLGYKKEIIIVDDGSIDNTYNIISSYKDIILIRQKNLGKGAAVQKGLSIAKGEYFLIQDADLEYNPKDYIILLSKLNENPNAVIYGSRILGCIRSNGFKFLPGKHKMQSFGPWLANLVLSLWTFLLYGKWITDTLTAYKIYKTSIIKNLVIKTKGFETDHELTAKLIKMKIKIHEVPIQYFPRSKAEGKKIKLSDGFVAILTLLRFRVSN
ncbi:glycosyltransferase family 2 protein [Fluviispira multicolorata]|uniref:Glycosyltransferase n=1 Tax=Fluviispira multicolorata TaxID=2654512 RepID=A0A833N4H1_9BACT|nr:glycosyltransferase family 2 protein [Fluviispira multicolorata]KAB8028000.1 glycosyltransferase [Fluviispira multicolorata]